MASLAKTLSKILLTIFETAKIMTEMNWRRASSLLSSCLAFISGSVCFGNSFNFLETFLYFVSSILEAEDDAEGNAQDEGSDQDAQQLALDLFLEGILQVLPLDLCRLGGGVDADDGVVVAHGVLELVLAAVEEPAHRRHGVLAGDLVCVRHLGERNEGDAREVLLVVVLDVFSGIIYFGF